MSKTATHIVPEGTAEAARRTAGQIVAAVDRAAVNGPDRFAADCLSVFLRANRRALERHIAERLARELKGERR